MATSLRSKWAVGKARGGRIAGPLDALSLAQGIRSPFHVYSTICPFDALSLAQGICVGWLAMSKRQRVEWLEVKAGEFRFESVKDSDFQP